jgi:hypothetical protein
VCQEDKYPRLPERSKEELETSLANNHQALLWLVAEQWLPVAEQWWSAIPEAERRKSSGRLRKANR